MRFTFILPADDLTGGNRVVATYAKIFMQRGHEVLVINNAPDQPGLRDRLRAIKNGRWTALGPTKKPPPGHIQLSGVPQRILERSRPVAADDLPEADFLIGTWWETAVWINAMPPSKGRKVHLIQGYEDWTGQLEQLHAALRLPNRKIVISHDLERTIHSHLPDLQLTVIPNAVDGKQFNAPPRDRNAPPRVGFIYARAPLKGADICLKAIELATLQLPDLQCLAFGADAPAPELPLSSKTNYVLRPPQEQIASLYAQCDAWLFGSRKDSFGLPILESMACRTPVIAVPVGAAPELLSDGAGILVPSEQPEAMAAALVSLLTFDQKHWRAMSGKAYAKAHGYTWDDAADRLLASMMNPD